MIDPDLVYARQIISAEAEAIAKIPIQSTFKKAIQICRKCTGNIVVSGAGKSGIVAQKLAATFASIGKRSWWLHPYDAQHGDIGKLAAKDVGILFSNSGETAEVLQLADHMIKLGCSVIAITGHASSSLEKIATITLQLGVIEEAGVIRQMPTSSSTASLVLADTLALAVAGREFKSANLIHPGGSIGIKLSKVDDLMRKGADCVIVADSILLKDAIVLITEARAGAAIVVDQAGTLCGMITDGDLRRFVKSKSIDGAFVKDCMGTAPQTIASGKLIEEAIELFKKHAIGDLPVTNSESRPLGMLSLKDLARVAW